MLSLEDLATLDPEPTWLELSAVELAIARTQVETQRYSHRAAEERAFYNTLCLNMVQPWLTAELDLFAPPILLPAFSQLPSVWEFLDGIRLSSGRMQWVIIPITDANADELRVPQEWVDIPDWSAHYYLAVYINLEAEWVKIMGCATHRQLQQSATYDPIDRTYAISQSELIQDLLAVTIAQAHFPAWDPSCNPIPDIAESAIQDWLEHLTDQGYSPRLDLPFAAWAALIAQAQWRRSLYERRLAVARNSGHPQSDFSGWSEAAMAIDSPPVRADRDLLPMSSSRFVYATPRGILPQQVRQSIVLGNQTILLVITRGPVSTPREPATRVSIGLEVTAASATESLPPELQFRIELYSYPSDGDPVLEDVVTGVIEPIRNLPRLFGIPGETFSITLTLGEFSWTEEFTI